MLFEKPSVHRLKSSYTICLTRAKRCMARCSPRLAERELSTNYTGFNLREPVPAERLLPVLKQDAAEFQRKYGDELKRQRVVR